MIHIIYMGLGSNIGDKSRNLHDAVCEIECRIGSVVSQSDMIITEPVGFSSDNLFMNQAICVKSELSAEEVLDITQDIERRLGRSSKSVDGVYHDRTIDIDILLFDDEIINTDRLTVPHPRMKERLFVLQPLAQIAPNLVIPGETRTITSLLDCIC